MNEKIPLISIIIPFYNVEPYIEKCLNSIVNQTYKNIEILLIDDAGQDNSIQIANNFLKIDSRIKILSYGENKGVSFARNYGLLNSKGEYIYFIDSDDFIDYTYIEEMLKNIEDLDIVQNNNWIEYISQNKINKIQYNNELSPVVWNKLYKKDFLINNNIEFPINVKMGEDLCFNYNCISLTNKIKYLSLNTYYFYRKNQNSAVYKYKKENDILEMFYILYNILKNNGSLNKISLPLYNLRRHLKERKDKNKMFKEIKKFFIEIKDSLDIKKYKQKDVLFFNCILNNKNYYYYTLDFTIKKLFKILK